MAYTNLDIYKNAISFIGQDFNNDDLSDMEQRAPYLLASFCCRAKNLDKDLRKIEDRGNQSEFSAVILTLEDNFHLLDRFATSAALYVASMLVLEENSELSESLYEKYCDDIASLASEIALLKRQSEVYSQCHPISDKYFFD